MVPCTITTLYSYTHTLRRICTGEYREWVSSGRPQVLLMTRRVQPTSRNGPPKVIVQGFSLTFHAVYLYNQTVPYACGVR